MMNEHIWFVIMPVQVRVIKDEDDNYHAMVPNAIGGKLTLSIGDVYCFGCQKNVDEVFGQPCLVEP